MAPILRLVLGIAAVCTIIVASSARAAGSAAYEDERNEVAGAPDIQHLTASNDDAGRIGFRVEIPSHPALTQDMRLRLWFSDGQPGSGLADSGADGFILVDGFLFEPGTAMLYRCQDTVCVPTASSREGTDDLRFSYANGAATFAATVGGLAVRVDASTRLQFSFVAQSGWAYDPATRAFDATNVRTDSAPSGFPPEWWTYDIRLGTGALAARSITTTPSPPRAGRNVTVGMRVVREGTSHRITSGIVRCAARIGSSALRPLAGRFAGQRAICVYRLPARAAGKTLRGSVTVSLAGKTVTRTFARRIR